MRCNLLGFAAGSCSATHLVTPRSGTSSELSRGAVTSLPLLLPLRDFRRFILHLNTGLEESNSIVWQFANRCCGFCLPLSFFKFRRPCLDMRTPTRRTPGCDVLTWSLPPPDEAKNKPKETRLDLVIGAEVVVCDIIGLGRLERCDVMCCLVM
jgi:hypothetical protein